MNNNTTATVSSSLISTTSTAAVATADNSKSQNQFIPDSESILEVYVRNVSYNATEETIYNLFQHCGKIERITLPRHPDSGKLKGFCFVKLATDTAVANACQLNRIQHLGRYLEIRRNKGKIAGSYSHLHGGGGNGNNGNNNGNGGSNENNSGSSNGVSPNYNCGLVNVSSTHSDTTVNNGGNSRKRNKHRRYRSNNNRYYNNKGTTVESSQSSSRSSLSRSNDLQQHLSSTNTSSSSVSDSEDNDDNNSLNLWKSKSPDLQQHSHHRKSNHGSRVPHGVKPHNCRTIYAGNVPFETTEAELAEFFGKCGEIVAIRIVRELQSNQSRGFSYIQFSDESAVNKAVNLNGTPINDRKIRIDYAEAFSPSPNHSHKSSHSSVSNATNNAAIVDTNGGTTNDNTPSRRVCDTTQCDTVQSEECETTLSQSSQNIENRNAQKSKDSSSNRRTPFVDISNVNRWISMRARKKMDTIAYQKSLAIAASAQQQQSPLSSHSISKCKPELFDNSVDVSLLSLESGCDTLSSHSPPLSTDFAQLMEGDYLNNPSMLAQQQTVPHTNEQNFVNKENQSCKCKHCQFAIAYDYYFSNTIASDIQHCHFYVSPTEDLSGHLEYPYPYSYHH